MSQKFGTKLINLLAKRFDRSIYDRESSENGDTTLYLPKNLNLVYSSNDVYIRFHKGKTYLYELDLTKIVRKSKAFTWYLNYPTNKNNQIVLDNFLPFVDDISKRYRDAVKHTKTELGLGTTVNKGGYQLCKNDNWTVLSEHVTQLFSLIIEEHSAILIGDPDDTFNPGDHEAFEGDEYGIFIKTKKRDRQLAEERKKKDSFTCQACNLQISVNNHPIIECHHINPLEFGKRKTTIDDLVSLCPTCHRVAHQKQPPYSVKEIKKFIRKI